MTAVTARTLRREIFTSRPLRNVGVAWMRRRVSTAMPSGHRQKRRMPVSWAGRIRTNRSASARWRCVSATSFDNPSAKPGAGCPADSARSSKPAARKTSRGSQHAPRRRSSQTSLRMFTICNPWPKETDSANRSSRRPRISAE